MFEVAAKMILRLVMMMMRIIMTISKFNTRLVRLLLTPALSIMILDVKL